MKIKFVLIVVGLIIVSSLLIFPSHKTPEPIPQVKKQQVIEKIVKEIVEEQRIFPEHVIANLSDEELDAELREREEFEADSEVVEAEVYESRDTQKADKSIDTMREDLALLKALEKSAAKTPTPVPTEEADDTSVVDIDNTIEDESDDVVSNRQLGGGVLSKSNSKHESETTIVNKPSQTPVVEATVEPRYAGQVRGYAMLYLMQPEARRTVEGELQTLIESRLSHVFLGVLTDGTFGKDFEYLSSVVKRIADAEMRLTLVLYLTNGSSMRRYTDKAIQGGFNNISPSEFRSLIKYDKGTQEKYLSMVREVLPVFQLNQSLNPGNSNIAVVMLEDNLDATSYKMMRDLTESVLGNLVSYVRNPCLGCYEGNDAESFGDMVEQHHSAALSEVTPGMGLTLDGEGFYFPWENGPGLSIDGVKFLQARAMSLQLAYVGLWRAKRQGIYGDGYNAPALRLYEVPTEEQREIEIQVLRDGLEEE